MPTTYKSAAKEDMHEGVLDLHRVGHVGKLTMRTFDARCLTPIEEFTPRKIRALRTRDDLSHAVFAAYLNVSVELLEQWERGEKKPQGASLKLLTLVKKKGLEIVT
jgi:putative transcriptional regulator